MRQQTEELDPLADLPPSYADKAAFSIRDLGELGYCQRTKVHQEITSGRLAIRKVGRKTIITRTALAAWIRDNVKAPVMA